MRGVRTGAAEHAGPLGDDGAVRRLVYVVYEDERYTYAEVDARVRALAAPPARRARRRRRRPRRAGDAQLPRVGDRLLGDLVHRRRGRRDERMVDAAEMEYGLDDSRPKVLIADDERARAGAAGARRACATRRRCTSWRCARTASCPTTPSVGRRGRPAHAPRRLPGCRHRPRRRRHDLLHVGHDRAFRRAPSSPTAARSTTCCNLVFWRVATPPPRPRPSPPATCPAPGRRPPPRRSRCSWRRRRCSTSPRATACCTRARSAGGASCSRTSGTRPAPSS